MSLFAVLTHDHPFPHWDLLLEAGESCRTWRLLGEPGPGRAVRAEALPDHRLHYLAYEGPVSGGRGTVCRWDGGMYEPILEEEGRVEVVLSGERLRGRCVLRAGPERWQAEFAAPAEIPSGEPRSR